MQAPWTWSHSRNQVGVAPKEAKEAKEEDDLFSKVRENHKALFAKIARYGSIQFDEAAHKTPSQFVLTTPDPDAIFDTLDLFRKVWNLPPPTAAISITCGSGDGVPEAGDHDMKRAILSVAEKTSAWILTKGNAGRVGRGKRHTFESATLGLHVNRRSPCLSPPCIPGSCGRCGRLLG